MVAATVCTVILDILDAALSRLGTVEASCPPGDHLARATEELHRVANLTVQFSRRYSSESDNMLSEAVMAPIAVGLRSRLQRTMDRAATCLLQTG